MNDYYNKEFHNFVGGSSNRERIYLKDLSKLFNRYLDQVKKDGTRYITFKGIIKNIEDLGISKKKGKCCHSCYCWIVIKKKKKAKSNQLWPVLWFQGCSNLKVMKLLLSSLKL